MAALPVASGGNTASAQGCGANEVGIGSWLEVERLDQALEEATLALLGNGEVILIGGGNDANSAFSRTRILDPNTGAWRNGPDLLHARRLATTNLLPDGQLLVIGGDLGLEATTFLDPTHRVEIYDPQSESFLPADSLTDERLDHASTRLLDGRILVTGGYTVSEDCAIPPCRPDPTNSTELYDPQTRTWSMGPAMGLARRDHTATRLADGQVLIVGGARKSEVRLSSVVLFDPSDDSWDASPEDLHFGRSRHSAVALDDGRVLVIGGLVWDGLAEDPFATASTELYDPQTRTWSAGPDLEHARFHFTADRLPDGRILIAGGRGGEGCPQLASVEIFDPSEDSMTTAEALPVARYGSASVLLPTGHLLMVGGKNEHTTVSQLATADLFATTGGHFTTAIGTLDEARSATTATLLPNGEALIVGGRGGIDDTGARASAEIFDPETEVFRRTMGDLVAGHTASTTTTLFDGLVAVVGGKEGDDFEALDRVSLYDHGTETFEHHDSVLVEARWGHTATLLPDGSLLVCGGFGDGEHRDSCERVDFAGSSPSSTLVAERPGISWFRHTATPLADGRVLLLGGLDGLSNTILRRADIYDPFALDPEEALREVEPMFYRRQRHTATPLANGKVLVTGGNEGSDTAEIYDPIRDLWRPTANLTKPFGTHTALLLADGSVLVFGGKELTPEVDRFEPATLSFVPAGPLGTPRYDGASVPLADGRLLTMGGEVPDPANPGDPFSNRVTDSAELFRLVEAPMAAVLPALDILVEPLDPLEPWILSGSNLLARTEGRGGRTQISDARPTLGLRSLSDGRLRLLDVAAATYDSITIEPPADGFDPPPPGFHILTPIVAGRMGAGIIVELSCGLSIDAPSDQSAFLGTSATFEVRAPGARAYQWQRSVEGGDWQDIEGATASSYQTPPVISSDHGNRYRVRAHGGCAEAISAPASLSLLDSAEPVVDITQPVEGEIWLLSNPGAEPRHESITWSIEDDLPIASLAATLDWTTVDGTEGSRALCDSGACVAPEPDATDVLFRMPELAPGGVGAEYRIRLVATDVAGNSGAGESRPFLMTDEDFTRRTLFLTHRSRLRSQGDEPDLQELFARLLQLAEHPRVQGLVVDLEKAPTFDQSLYEAWDANPEIPHLANDVLFGENGVQDIILKLKEGYPALEYLVLVGGDSVIPFARVESGTSLLTERQYVGEHGLPADAAPAIEAALLQDLYFSDDPLAVLEALSPIDLDTNHLFIADLAVGRLVETPDEIDTTLGSFLDRDGLVHIDEDGSGTGRGVVTSGYDFLVDVASRVSELLREAIGTAAVDADLLEDGWGPSSEVARERLHGRLSTAEAVYALFGHADHEALGVPGQDPYTDIQGLPGIELADADSACSSTGSRDTVELLGALVFGVGCHGGLSVPGSCSDEATFDLPQAVLGAGALGYVANSGYGWGLLHGIGYSERLVQLFTTQLIDGNNGRPLSIGHAVRKAKLEYLMENSRPDVYDLVTLQQWTFFGLPMAEIRLPDSTESGSEEANETATDPEADGGGTGDGAGGTSADSVVVTSAPAQQPLPGITAIATSINFQAPGVFQLYSAEGEEIEDTGACNEENGCYYALNGLASGEADRPIEPYFFYEAALSGTRPRGTIWLGGTTRETADWKPVIGLLTSNLDQAPEPTLGLPRTVAVGPIPTSLEECGHDTVVTPGGQSESRGRVLVHAGMTIYESLPDSGNPLPPAVHRLFEIYELETFYSTDLGCGGEGPSFGPGPFTEEGQPVHHHLDLEGLEFRVPVEDEQEVWRVVVVWTEGHSNLYRPLELLDAGDGHFEGRIDSESLETCTSDPQGCTLTYLIQAVDRTGRVSTLGFEQTSSAGAATGALAGSKDGPIGSGLDLELPRTVDVVLEPISSPSLVRVRTVPTGSYLHAGDRLDFALARLDIELSVPVVLSGSIDLVPLDGIEPGTEPGCTDDPAVWPQAFVTWGPTAKELSLKFFGQPPPAGNYRLLICDIRAPLGGPEEPLVEAFVDFELTIDHLLSNGGFDDQLSGWSTLGDPHVALVNIDASGAPDSRSLNLQAGYAPADGSIPDPGAHQCVPMAAEGSPAPRGSTPYVATLRARTDRCHSAPTELEIVVRSYTEADCAGLPAPSGTARSTITFADGPPTELGADTYPHEQWVDPRLTFGSVEGARSVDLRISASADAPCDVWIDEIELHASPGGLFVDGFETGNTNKWDG